MQVYIESSHIDNVNDIKGQGWGDNHLNRNRLSQRDLSVVKFMMIITTNANFDRPFDVCRQFKLDN